MKILLVGNGGREHAMAEALKRSPKCTELFCAPGGPALEEYATSVDIPGNDIQGLARFAQANDIGLTVVGPEEPLVLGITDLFESMGLKVFGPSKAAAALEGSKSFTKNLLRKYRIPSGDYRVFDAAQPARGYIETDAAFPLVIKADGLAAGKGVVICKDAATAMGAIERIMTRREFGEAGSRLVVEDFLEGEEASVLAFTDGHTIVPLPAAKDHKAVYDGDAGPNTGGMGAYCPSPLIHGPLYERIEQEVLIPVVHALNREGRPYKGVLYAGLMITSDGPKVLEFNVRFGDPEAQVILPRLKADLVDVALMTIEGRLEELEELECADDVALTVVMASEGYPGKPQTGRIIRGLDQVAAMEHVKVYHSGTTRDPDGTWRTAGGRVLGVTALGATMEEARSRAYQAVDTLSFQGAHFRRDIGVPRDT